MKKNDDTAGLAELVERGGVFYDISGDTPKKILEVIISRLPESSCLMLNAILEREAFMSTAIGEGIALLQNGASRETISRTSMEIIGVMPNEVRLRLYVRRENISFFMIPTR
jgi:mannitol/fructose-specific phosphotransferase system IIA component